MQLLAILLSNGDKVNFIVIVIFFLGGGVYTYLFSDWNNAKNAIQGSFDLIG